MQEAQSKRTEWLPSSTRALSLCDALFRGLMAEGVGDGRPSRTRMLLEYRNRLVNAAQALADLAAPNLLITLPSHARHGGADMRQPEPDLEQIPGEDESRRAEAAAMLMIAVRRVVEGTAMARTIRSKQDDLLRQLGTGIHSRLDHLRKQPGHPAVRAQLSATLDTLRVLPLSDTVEDLILRLSRALERNRQY